MGKKINVRVSRTKLIATLKESLARLGEDKKKHEEVKAKREKWESDSKNLSANTILSLGKRVELDWDDWSHRRLQDNVIHCTIRVEISRDVAANTLGWVAEIEKYKSVDSDIEAVAQVIRVLELCDDDTVSAGTYDSVIQYL